MRAPEEFWREQVDARLTRGTILRVTLDRTTLDDPAVEARSKYLVIVNGLPLDDTAWFILTTSNPKHFDDNPRFENDIVRIAAGAYPWCTQPVTVLDCTTVYSKSVAALRELYKQGKATFEGQLTIEHLAAVDRILRGSVLIMKEHKRWIVPW